MSKVAVFEYYPEESIVPLTLPDGTVRNISLNPGVAFGKGYHSTTRLCVKSIENIYRQARADSVKIISVLDIGCGSGVLAICAAVLGAKEVTGLDIDHSIVTEAVSNVEINNCESQVRIMVGSPEELGESFDLVTANIRIDSIIAISAEIEKVLNPGATLITSGIKSGEKQSAIKRFRELGLIFEQELSERNWVALKFRKPPV